MTPFNHAGLAVIDNGLIPHTHTSGNIGGQAIAELVGILRHLFLREDGRAPRIISTDDTFISKGSVDLVRIAVRRVVKGFVISTHSTCQQARVAHLIMCRLENGLSVRCQAWNKGIVCVHPDLFQQRRCTKIRNDKERHFLDFSIHHKLEHAFQGNPSTADGLEYRRKGG